MKTKLLMLACSVMAINVAAKETITIATVNNGDMITMKELSNHFEEQNPDISLKWVTLEENILRQRVTTDVATKGGQYDVMTIGTYEVPIWGKQNWLTELDNLGENYDVDDLLPAIRSGLTIDNKLYAAPFYGESSMVMYRTDLMEKAGLEMPNAPTWSFIQKAAKAMTNKDEGVYGLCLRGKAGWGENVALITSMANSFGARWFDENWKPQFNTPEWKATLQYYVDVMKESGPAGSSANGFNENLALFQTGKCGIWIDATVAGAFVTNKKDSEVADKVGFALAPDNGLGKRGNWLWSWTLAIPSSSKKSDAAMKFISWATSKEYSQLVADNKGWAKVPPGTRASLYENEQYMNAAPFAQITLDSINSADPKNPTVKPVPYVGIQFVAIPEFQGIGTAVGQQFSAALTGQMTVEQALNTSQRLVERTMRKARYPK
ncbi:MULTISPECIES: sugar ABC transporter substrate-binding protein [Pseudoalteromonas]|jgi:sorbitol/mannitol transport system substrate-binding protein|uniref:ABC transporter substrate-binding protein n=1 Tax=Pseudoalteromonas TaxID=53246 RepID=UPI00042403FC|nr:MULTISPECIES: sugar ABC transporter substrate-binding protein [Pseudoalteromonas]MDY6889039.1 sugar ABC transporter substrate-binding protein [Pseudomonadota bacterium]KPV92629.1 putative ABC transporter-binding protein precursor [Pseudoalteromonas sp. P1-30]KPW03373.1 putative ABC transporter-binding protein precursor [Pseudoalteromonas sp. P1-11]MCK8094285.1 sugar ABC transporter substrate-binding protein [Pseudoalteromonas sp. 1CM17D]MCK8116282.1 sugar ABC transporter substrate-binding p